VWPRKRQLALVSLLAGLLLGAGWVLLRDALDNSIKDGEDVERRLHLPLLAAIPRYTKDDTALATEAYQNLRTGLLFARRGSGGQVVLVTGAAPGEGKTTTLLNLGKLLAAAGESTVVVDCDLRRANLHTRLNVPREPGFTDHFVRQLDLSGLIRTTRHKNLSVIPAGPLPPNPPALLARPELRTALDQLRRHFRWVLIDSPPVAAVTDALLMAHEANSTILVVQQNKVDRAVLKRAVTALRKVTPQLVGAVLNAVDVKSKAYYGYGYGYGYRAKKAKKDAPGRHGRARGRRATATEVSDVSLT
jgi:capsular exopolysaccharide synthesis family protein